MTGVTPMSLDDSGESKEELTLKNAVVPAANEDCSDTYTKKPAFSSVLHGCSDEPEIVEYALSIYNPAKKDDVAVKADQIVLLCASNE